MSRPNRFEVTLPLMRASLRYAGHNWTAQQRKDRRQIIAWMLGQGWSLSDARRYFGMLDRAIRIVRAHGEPEV